MNTKNQNSGANIQGDSSGQDKFGSTDDIAQGSVAQGDLGQSNRAQGSLGQSNRAQGSLGQSQGNSSQGSQDQSEFGQSEVAQDENIQADYIGPTDDLDGAVEVEAQLDDTDDLDDVASY